MSEKYIRVEDVQDNSIAAGLCDGQGNLYGADIVFRLSDIDTTVPTYTPADILAGQWVPVAERLPRPGERVLVCLASSIAIEGYLTTIGTWERHGMTIAGLYGRDVTHWMPLPQPPKSNIE